jgi:hypothetical protein
MTTDFPRFDDSPANWKGPVLAETPEQWTHTFSKVELADLAAVIDRFGDRDDDMTNVSLEDVPMPTLAPKLRVMRSELLDGIGLKLLRGFPAQNYTLRQAATAFWAVGLHLGEPVSQNAKGHVLGHVQDLGFDASVPSARGYQTAERLAYHCDAGDVVGLLSVKTAKSGGRSSAVSSTALYHAMIDRRPDLAAVLMQPTWRDRRNEIPADRDPWYLMPIFNPHQGRMFGHYVRSAIRKAQRFEEAPRISKEQDEAFDYLDALAGSEEFRLEMEFQPGDMQFVCNHWILHSRTRFEDWPELERRRHLLRLWLACPGGPDVPETYVRQQGLTASGRPAGIHCPDSVLNAPLIVVDGGAGDTAERVRVGAS